MKVLAQKDYPTYVQNPDFVESPRMPREAILQFGQHEILNPSNLYQVIKDIFFISAQRNHGKYKNSSAG
jgi:hypothetical protein